MNAPQFIRPDSTTRNEAIGPVTELPHAVQRLLDSAEFTPIAKPAPGDWLANYREPGQTRAQFLRSHPHFPDDRRRTIYLQPLEHFKAGEGRDLARLQAFTEAYFSMRVKIPAAPPADALKGVSSRINPDTGKPQLLTGDLLERLKLRLPADAYCLLGLTMHDLYPGPEWNFVFGEASLTDRVGVHSFVRYDPRFEGVSDMTPAQRTRLILMRSCKVLAHETGHMFGLAHCTYFRCVMNGSNSLPESDSQPLQLCPVDLRKLYESVRFDPVARYAHLREFCVQAGFQDDARWIERQLARVGNKASRSL